MKEQQIVWTSEESWVRTSNLIEANCTSLLVLLNFCLLNFDEPPNFKESDLIFGGNGSQLALLVKIVELEGIGWVWRFLERVIPIGVTLGRLEHSIFFTNLIWNVHELCKARIWHRNDTLKYLEFASHSSASARYSFLVTARWTLWSDIEDRVYDGDRNGVESESCEKGLGKFNEGKAAGMEIITCLCIVIDLQACCWDIERWHFGHIVVFSFTLFFL